ncbi:MAG: IS110 family transposase [Nitrososphaeria archaeon]
MDAHKRKCVVAMFNGSSEPETFEFQTTREGIEEFMKKVPEGSTVVIETSTTGKALSMILSEKYDVHMIAPPERKPQVKTDIRDAKKIVFEEELGYAREVYVPSPYIEELRNLVARSMELGAKISAVKNQIHALIERNLLQSEFEGMTDMFGAEGLEKLSNLDLPENESKALWMYLEELSLYAEQHKMLDAEFARIASSDEDCKLLMTIPGVGPFVAVAIKARIGDISRFPDKQKLASYAGLVPKADNSGEHVSRHNRLKHGDNVLKAALTIAARGAASAKSNNSIKKRYVKMLRKRKAPQDA